jgi:hypothetical protein
MKLVTYRDQGGVRHGRLAGTGYAWGRPGERPTANGRWATCA